MCVRFETLTTVTVEVTILWMYLSPYALQIDANILKELAGSAFTVALGILGK
jgi:hypothetical protein